MIFKVYKIHKISNSWQWLPLRKEEKLKSSCEKRSLGFCHIDLTLCHEEPLGWDETWRSFED